MPGSCCFPTTACRCCGKPGAASTKYAEPGYGRRPRTGSASSPGSDHGSSRPRLHPAHHRLRPASRHHDRGRSHHDVGDRNLLPPLRRTADHRKTCSRARILAFSAAFCRSSSAPSAPPTTPRVARARHDKTPEEVRIAASTTWPKSSCGASAPKLGLADPPTPSPTIRVCAAPEAQGRALGFTFSKCRDRLCGVWHPLELLQELIDDDNAGRCASRIPLAVRLARHSGQRLNDLTPT